MSGTWSRTLVTVVSLCIVSTVLLTACATRVDEPVDDQGDAPIESADDQAMVDADDVESDEIAETPEVADDEAEGFPVTVTRTDNVELTIEERPERIVSLSPGATETFFEVGAGDQLVAVDMFSDYPPEAAALAQLDAYQPDPEAIVDLEPDLVFVVFDADGIVSVLDDLDVDVLFLDAPSSVDGMMEQIRTLGAVTGNPVQADETATALEERVEAVTTQVPDRDEPLRVYHELDETFFTVSPESFVGDVYNLLGVDNIADGAMGAYPQLSEEVILDENPDLIVVPTHGQPDGERADEVRQRTGWDVIHAVSNDRIYEIDGDIISRPGPRIVDALEHLAEMFYPEEFVSSYGIPIAHRNLEIAAAAW